MLHLTRLCDNFDSFFQRNLYTKGLYLFQSDK